MKKSVAPLLLFIPASAFAAAGIADAYDDHQRWMLPAYAYCLAFGLIFLLVFVLLTKHWKTRTKTMTDGVSTYLKRHSILAIIFSGILLAVPIGIMVAVSWDVISFLAIFPFMGFLIGLPVILVNRRCREEFLLSSFWIKWGIMVLLSSCLASLLFVVLTNRDLLVGTDITYYARPSRIHPNSFLRSHPYDSMIEIWSMSMVFICEIVVALIVYLLGVIYSKLKALLSRFWCGCPN
jgi:hypothetical protein